MPTTLDTFPSLFAGYSAMFSILAMYLVVLGRKASRIERQLHLSLNSTAGGADDSNE